MPGKFCGGQNLFFSLNLAIFGHFKPIDSIWLIHQNDVVSEQYFLYEQKYNILFQMPVSFQEVIGIFGEDITV